MGNPSKTEILPPPSPSSCAALLSLLIPQNTETPALEPSIMLQTGTKAANKLIWAKLIYLQISYLPFFPVAIPPLQAGCHFNHDFHNIFIKCLHMFPRLALSREWYKKPFWKEYDPEENLSVFYVGVRDEQMQFVLLLNKVFQSIVWKIKSCKSSLLSGPSSWLTKNVPIRKDGETKRPWATANPA